MRRVFLFHAGLVQHYRIGVYNYLSSFLKKSGFELTIISEGNQLSSDQQIEFPESIINFSLSSLIKIVKNHKPWAIILFINHREKYFFPFLFYLRASGNKVITWTHGINLQDKGSLTSRLAHHLEHTLCNRIILYSDPLKAYLLQSHRQKAHVANNTLNLLDFEPKRIDRQETLSKYNIKTRKNIVYSGRITRRKRIQDLLSAFELIKDENIGLILLGPDDDKIIAQQQITGKPRLYYLGPVYGSKTLEILSASDVCCIPGAIGLGIVDAMYCGLPVVTEKVPHGPEFMYFKDGLTGYMVSEGDIASLAEKLKLLLTDDDLRTKMGEKAREEIMINGHIDRLAEGFLECLESLEGKRKMGKEFNR
jgi:glycosyltransferase involved in cell wall biosynthesis